MRITVACPAGMIDDANHLAMALAFGPADGLTYRDPTWQDGNGNLYAAASFVASEQWLQAAQEPLARPDWDADEIIDIDAANRAQGALVFDQDPESEPAKASPNAITAGQGNNALSALAAMGLSRNPLHIDTE